MHTQDNRITADPIFVVQERKGRNGHFCDVTFCFTDVGAQNYIDVNGHNHRGELRIFVKSLWRNAEMIAVRNHLMSLTEETS